ncbi:sporulation and spore germination [Clostridium acetireducens DSM 10703]|jgi:germination protein M|uniref:Sporulation and spore germination n=1 Tax=Clostridium acetireducens DSM 10703 TaxID=1121290 RepID=A0A1E8F0E1_9CLOT|nr:GerMN domain-containing protein [Clostridium acetireducens]OFI06599.1 sporulation and spore germination [Clostridium acetireducens DSM 10703]
MKKNISLLLAFFIIFSTISFTSCEKKDKVSINNKEKVKNIALPNEQDNIIDLSLYFDSSTDSNKSEVAKEERLIKKEELIGELIVQELINGPSVNSKLKPILPKETRLISFSIKDGIAYINLSKEAQISMTPEKEKSSLKSIVYSLTQLPSIKKISVLVENKNIKSLGGNFNWSKPIGKEDVENVK